MLSKVFEGTSFIYCAVHKVEKQENDLSKPNMYKLNAEQNSYSFSCALVFAG